MGGPVLNIVTTFDGTKALKSNCRFIKGLYYEKDRQCFLMPNGKWNRIDNGRIVFDNRDKVWRFLTDVDLSQGIIGVEDGNPIIGYFTASKNDTYVTLEDGNEYPLIEEGLLANLDILENIGNGKFYIKKLVPENSISKDGKYFGNKEIYNYRERNLEYDSYHSLEDVIKSHEKAIKISDKDKVIDFFSEELGNTTFGIEFETWNGTVRPNLLNELGLIPLKDGSLRHDGVTSYEYATIPFKGASGVYKLKRVCEALTKYTEISTMCSTHLHIGGYDISKEFIVALFLISKKLESNIFRLFPRYFKDTSKFKKKSYCGPLPNFRINAEDDVKESFRAIYEWLSNNNTFERFDTKFHPDDPGGTQKWNISSRYFWLNFVPFIWGKSRTIEFRVHPPTTNFIKSLNWVFICNAIMKYAYDNRNNLEVLFEEITLPELFSKVYSKNDLVVYLTKYVETLYNMRDSYDCNSDFTGIEWCNTDSEFTFDGEELLNKYI